MVEVGYGYVKYPNGFCEQWGTIKTNSSGYGVINYDIPFLNENCMLTATALYGSDGAGYGISVQTNSPSTGYVYVRNLDDTIPSSVDINWRASGYVAK